MKKVITNILTWIMVIGVIALFVYSSGIFRRVDMNSLRVRIYNDKLDELILEGEEANKIYNLTKDWSRKITYKLEQDRGFYLNEMTIYDDNHQIRILKFKAPDDADKMKSQIKSGDDYIKIDYKFYEYMSEIGENHQFNFD